MPDNSKKFHEFALKSFLFKGRADWYFCYLKAEKIAHVLWIISGAGEGTVRALATRAAELPRSVAYLAAGEADAAAVLADVFALLSDIRTAATEQAFDKDTAQVLCKEYEELAQRLVAGSHPSPFLSAEDFRITPLPELGAPQLTHQPIKDIETKRTSNTLSNKIMSDRMSLILDFIKRNKRSSIKEIAAVVKGCSEKTIQRELGELIHQGLIRKEGERRWSVYIPA